VSLDSEEQAFLGLINIYRAQNGVAPLAASPALTRAARRHAADMATNNFIDHVGSDEHAHAGHGRGCRRWRLGRTWPD
jgi:uncharacterized protein YkwD